MYEYLDKLNERQKQAATTIDGPLLIVAGAGSGKTTTLISRVAYMIDQGIDPKNILLLTFTNEAAKNMIDKASKMSKTECQNITACTYHSFCANMLRMYGNYIGLNNFDIISGADSQDIIDVIRIKDVNHMFNSPGFPTNKNIVSIFSMAVNTNQNTPQKFEKMLEANFTKFVCYSQDLLILFNLYVEYKKQNRLLDYDDLLVFMNRLILVDQIRDLLSDHYKYIMVDEYQDTNYWQEKMVLSLSDKYKNIAVVGDDYQSIYKFRGSDINNILNFPTKMPNTKIITLDINYRSTKQIINVANTVMNNHADFGFKKEMKDADNIGKKSKIIKCKDQTAEAEYIYQKIKELIQNGAKPNTIAVLSRSSAGMTYLELCLNKDKEMKIPYVKRGGIKFFERNAIRDMLGFMKAIVYPTNSLAWIRISRLIKGVGSQYSVKIGEEIATKKSIQKFKGNRFYEDLSNLIKFIMTMQKKDDFNKMAEDIKDYYITLRKDLINSYKTNSQSKIEELNQILEEDLILIDMLLEMTKGSSIKEFIDDLILDEKKEDSEDSLILSTVHSAKGLEWENVFILDCVDGVFPAAKIDDKDEFGEELRCFYVALTRAKKGLFFMCPKYINRGNMIYGNETKILKEAEIYTKINNIDKDDQNHKKIYLNVPFSQKEIVKKEGARWDAVERSWYAEKWQIDNSDILKDYLLEGLDQEIEM